ncbi:MAG: HAD-IA family hydrolase, partial [Euryarchaeota archaeon]|nr:HAD-IA family hydrolase [Euryarchaeota archaeon]
RLDAVLAQDAYSEDKPHPEPYQKAAEALGVGPVECVAVENAVRGVQSAKAAGYGHVIGITTTMPTEALDAAGADTVVADHETVGARIARLFAQAR